MNRHTKNKIAIFLSCLFLATHLGAEKLLIDDFNSNSNSKWHYVSDQVMGGVSQGNLDFDYENSNGYAHLKGNVSTENNGGFIQFRADLDAPTTSKINGVYLKVMGNNQKYFVHMRTKGTFLPWQYYQSAFKATSSWQTIKLPIDTFSPSSGWLRRNIKFSSIKSIGIVAFGRDHIADLRVSEVGFY